MTQKETEIIYPKESWIFETRDNESYDMFDSILPFIINKTNTTGLMVVYHGKVIFHYGDIEEVSYIASCRKSVLAMLFGRHVENGTIDLNLTMEELGIDDIQGLLPNEKKATILDLITSRSGIYHPSSNIGDSFEDAPARGSQQPGEYFLYNNWDFNACGEIFEKLTGTDIYDALEKDLAVPIGMEDFEKNKQNKEGDNSKSNFLAYHMWFSTRDMARLGYLMLREGNWNGKQIISRSWIREMLKVSTPREEMNPKVLQEGNCSYGYMWWLFDNPQLSELYDRAFTAAGYYGQYITVIPKLDLVIAHKTKAEYLRTTRNYHELSDLIVNGIHMQDNLDMKEIEQTELNVLHKYIGEYRNETDTAIIKISEEDNILYATSKKRGKYKLCLCRKHIYRSEKDTKLIFEFDFDKERNVKGITVTYVEWMVEYTKIK